MSALFNTSRYAADGHFWRRQAQKYEAALTEELLTALLARLTGNAYALLVEGESYRQRLKPNGQPSRTSKRKRATDK